MPPDIDLETALLGHLVPGRECGDCVVCCTVLKVDTPEFGKPEGQPCIHGTGNGCGIHATRPAICRDWYCAWRRVSDMPEAARPDRSGLLVSLDFNPSPRNCLEGVAITIRSLDDGAALDGAMARRMTDALSDRLVPIWLSDGATKTLVHPAAEVAAFVISGDPPPARWAGDVAAWRSRYDMFR